jgi:hypothetical protein
VTSLVPAAVSKHRSLLTPAFYTTLAARQQRAASQPPTPTYAEAVVNGPSEPPTAVDSCTYTEGSVDLLFDPKRVLLRFVYFLNPEKTKYISVGFYPGRNYQPLVEIGSPQSTLIILTDQHVNTLSQHLTAQVDALWRGEFYNVLDCDLAIHSASPYNAILSLGTRKQRKTMFTKLNDLRYLAYIFPLVEDQLIKHNETLPDVKSYVLTALHSTSYLEPPSTASRNVLYQLYQEIKTLL